MREPSPPSPICAFDELIAFSFTWLAVLPDPVSVLADFDSSMSASVHAAR